MRIHFALLTSLLFLLSGCSQINVADYSGFTNIPPDGIPTNWEYELSPEYPDSILDLTKLYDVVIAVRYTPTCPSQSVIFNIEEFSLSHEYPDSTTVELTLFDNDGQPLGKSRYGIFEVTDTIRRGYRLPPGYSLSLSSPLPSASTTGIKAVGLVLADQNRPKQFFKIKI